MESTEPTREQIINTLDQLGIQRRDTYKQKGWMDVICPAHNDSHFGNAGIYVSGNSFPMGLINCYACGYKTNLPGLVMYMLGYTFPEALDYIGIERDRDYRYNKPLQQRKEKPKLVEEIKIDTVINSVPHVPFNPTIFEYTRTRGYTESFLSKFNIGVSEEEGWYKNYMIIPINDKEQDINTFEARKLIERGCLLQYLNMSDRHITSRLKNVFKETVTDSGFAYRKGKVYIHNVEFMNPDPRLLYLLKPKVLYPKGNSQIADTIFNVDNLDFNQDVYICEGISGVPKVWTNLSENVTAIFGAVVSDKQYELLDRFKGRKIILPDNDEAGNKMIWKMTKNISDVWVLPTTIEDTDPDYENHIQKLKPVKAVDWMMSQTGFKDLLKIK